MKDVRETVCKPEDRTALEAKKRRLEKARKKIEQIDRGYRPEMIYDPDGRHGPTDIKRAAEETKRLRDQLDKLR